MKTMTANGGDGQLLLPLWPDGQDAGAMRVWLVEQLEQQSGKQLDVRFHRNRWTYFSCETTAGRDHLRVGLHEAFLDASPKVIRAVATLIRREDARARRLIRSFVDAQSHIWDALSDRPPRQLKIKPRGEVYDLRAIFDELNRRYFDGQCSAQITWGNGSRTMRGRRQITFGTYDETTGVIRVHPYLDRRRVPQYFVRYIIYHEMLHVTLPSQLSPGGRRLYHSRVFRQRERMFEDFERAQQWGERFSQGKT